jgi:hypothetical protein
MSVTAALSATQNLGCELRACIVLDFATVGSAPIKKIVGIYDDFFYYQTTFLDIFDGRLDLGEPAIITWHVGVDSLPPRPILLSQPRDCNPDLGHGFSLTLENVIVADSARRRTLARDLCGEGL